jgi:membrane associated rhomboid family serine protease
MFPIQDSNPSKSPAIINWLIILLNILVFLVEISLGQSEVGQLVRQFALSPVNFSENPGNPQQIATLFTSMFLHGGWLHIIANMWALWIFGDNVEDRLGHFNYLLFYFVCGAIAGLTQVFINPHVAEPTIGASGAIAGVLGAYLMLFPNATVLTLIPLGFIPWFIRVPAYIFLCFWFVTQAVAGLLALGNIGGAVAQHTQSVAWFAHVGGFVTGFITVKIWERSDYPKSYTDEYRPF